MLCYMLHQKHANNHIPSKQDEFSQRDKIHPALKTASTTPEGAGLHTPLGLACSSRQQTPALSSHGGPPLCPCPSWSACAWCGPLDGLTSSGPRTESWSLWCLSYSWVWPYPAGRRCSWTRQCCPSQWVWRCSPVEHWTCPSSWGSDLAPCHSWWMLLPLVLVCVACGW